MKRVGYSAGSQGWLLGILLGLVGPALLAERCTKDSPRFRLLFLAVDRLVTRRGRMSERSDVGKRQCRSPTAVCCRGETEL